jgi:outer membrane phospholipase A
MSDFYFGFTQLSFWDLQSFSRPFRDSNYRPSVFYYRKGLTEWNDSKGRMGFQGGFEHESNGKAGDESRSINILFIRPIFEFGDRNAYHLTVAPKAYVYIDKDDNRDIDHYRGFADFLVGFGSHNGVNLTGILRKGTQDDRGSIQFDASIPIAHNRENRPTGYLYFQHFMGWGESLLDYNRKIDSQFRVGVAIIR